MDRQKINNGARDVDLFYRNGLSVPASRGRIVVPTRASVRSVVQPAQAPKPLAQTSAPIKMPHAKQSVAAGRTLHEAKPAVRRALRLDEIQKKSAAVKAVPTTAAQLTKKVETKSIAPPQPAQMTKVVSATRSQSMPRAAMPLPAQPHQITSKQVQPSLPRPPQVSRAQATSNPIAPTQIQRVAQQPQRPANAAPTAIIAEAAGSNQVTSEVVFTDILERQRKKAQPLSQRFKLRMKSRTWSDYLRYGVVAVVLIVSGYLAFDTWMTNRQAREVFSQSVSALRVAGDSNGPSDLDETSVSNEEKNSYRVPFDMPRYLTIPKIGVHARVLSVGITESSKIDAPKSIHDVGWYDGSAKPNTEGAAFIDGHTAGANIGGVFDRLPNLQNGDTVTVELGDGKKINYKVVNIETVSASNVDMLRALSVHGDQKQGLNLMTCSGRYDTKTRSYDKRTIVYTVRI